ncbi:MAG: tRNA 4-thiouridine(8) synthase ThiI [Methanomicrobiales archaeon]|nr:tRNA 4-thiouridine(8) synthase ThiI [Methanomicrobiales archaeon]
MTEAVMVRYGELFLKSAPVMKRFIAALTRNINSALEAAFLTHRIEVHRGRILVHGEDPRQIADAASRVFGVVGVSVVTVTDASVDAIAEVAAERAGRCLKDGMSFAVRARRSGVPGFTSQQLAASVGARILSGTEGIRVDLDHPDYEIFVEAREFGGLVYDSRIDGPGGLPGGTQGKVLALFSGGIDSPVATWLMMRRGCTATLLHMAGGRWAGKDLLPAVHRHHGVLSRWSPGMPLELVVADMEPVYDRLVGMKEPRYRCVLCKRFMFRTASALALPEGTDAVVTGENLGQVASQTLRNLSVIAGAASVPVLRPLIGHDKSEIVQLARKIGTFDEAQGETGCLAVPRYPSTAARDEVIREKERELDLSSLVEEILATAQRYRALNGETSRIR